MAAYSSNSELGFGFSGTLEPLWRDFGSAGVLAGRTVSQALVLDGEKGELVKASLIAGKKAVPEEKVIAALKNHSEAERRRRERINSHLDTLRQLLPRKQKMDKATLLMEVIKQVRELKENACQESQGFLIPMDDDEVKVELLNCESNGMLSFKATVCYEYSAEVMVSLQQALDALRLEVVRSEVSTLQGRVKNEFVFLRTRIVGQNDEREGNQSLIGSVHRALKSVIEKATAAPEYLPRGNSTTKRRRIHHLEYSTSSCSVLT